MSLKKAALTFLALSLIPAGSAAYFVHRDYAAAHHRSNVTGLTDGAGGTVGDDHLRVLAAITKSYAAGKAPSVTPAMRAGTELAPTPVLNAALEKQGLRWRVREVHGMMADTFDVG